MAKNEIYGIVKIPTASLTDGAVIPEGAIATYFENKLAARKYSQEQLELPSSMKDLSWQLPNPKEPNNPIGLQQSYLLIEVSSDTKMALSPTPDLTKVQGCLGQAPVPERFYIHSVTIGRDSAGPTIYRTFSPSGHAHELPHNEVEERMLTCKAKQAKLIAEVERAQAKQSKVPTPQKDTACEANDEPTSQQLIDRFAEELIAQGLPEDAKLLQQTFHASCVANSFYASDGKTEAYKAIHSVFSKVSRDAVINNNFELATSAKNVSRMADDMLHDIQHEDEYTDNRGHLSADEASSLLGRDITDELGVPEY